MKFRHIDNNDRIDLDRIVDNPEYFDKNKNFTDDGLFSEAIFGELLVDHDYSCKCKKFIGQAYEGYKCDKCNTYVDKSESNIEKTGWIVLHDGVKLVSYIYYKMLERIIGKSKLINILDYDRSLNNDGFLVTYNKVMTGRSKNVELEDPELPYMAIGVMEFHDKYEEILEHYYEIKMKKQSDKKQRKKITEIYNTLLKDKHYVFIDKIPVISISLRPVIRIGDSFRFDEINDAYSNILHENKVFTSKFKGDKLIQNHHKAISRMQFLLNQLSKKIINNIEGKSGLIRGNIMGTRVNMSSRCVIVPQEIGVKFNEIILPYLAFMELYKYEIINDLKNFHNISYMDAEDIWYKGTLKKDEFIFGRIKKMIQNNNICILLNRNPTISYGSILYLDVVDIKEDYDDLTAAVNNTILACLAGDYDGDVLNIISIKDNEMKEVFKKVYDPENFVIDSNNSKFNHKMNLERDQILGIFSLNTMEE